ncbi:MAG: glycosyltransferase family 2 protein, partial [Acidobacteria bacterium]|nr:glycosyltransferase family 2 protein [Acidobacteriota bacterium]
MPTGRETEGLESAGEEIEKEVEGSHMNKDIVLDNGRKREEGAKETVTLDATASTAVAPLRAAVAILIPCYNEELTIAEVVNQFRARLPDADIYVFDNNSSDRTVEKAREAGAIICHEKRQGKGYVVQSMFRQIDADIYVMVDGDGTYPPADVHRLIEPILRDEADMVVGSRLHDQSQSQFKSLNRFGNRVFLSILNSTFHVKITDM